MNPPRCDRWTISTFSLQPNEFSCAPKLLAANHREKTHLCMTLLLASCSDSLPTRGIVTEAEGLVDNRSGFLVLDDTTLDKPYAQKTELVTYHWSGKHQKVVRGINLLTLLDRWKSPHTL